MPKPMREPASSPLHVLTFAGGFGPRGGVTTCQRCGSNTLNNETQPYHCYARPEWLRAHPEDERKTR